MSLSALPVEILQEIAYYIPEWPRLGMYRKADFTAVHGLTTSCTYLYTVFKPYLYQSIYTDAADLFLLVRSMKEDPSLTTLVKDFSISRTRTANFDVGKAYTLIKKLAVLPKSCKRHLHPADTKTIKLLLLESLLVILRRIEKLSINLEAIDSASRFFETKRWRASPANLLPRLEKLEIVIRESPDYSPGALDLTQVESILNRPRKIYVEFLKSVLTMSHRPVSLPRLHTLEIMCETMPVRDFERLIRSCPNLHTFSIYGNSDHPVTFDGWGIPQVYLSVTHLVEILEAHQPNLRTLSIHLTKDEDYDWFLDERETLPDFRVFYQLRHLDLDFNYLLNFEDDDEAAAAAAVLDLENGDENMQFGKAEFLHKLPRSLEVLRIFLADDRGLKEFNSLAERKDRDFPRLKRLELEMYDEYMFGPDPPTPQLDKLIENLANVKIDVTLAPGTYMTTS